jgi:hypothetical protein
MWQSLLMEALHMHELLMETQKIKNKYCFLCGTRVSLVKSLVSLQ